jgi:hypothetical protein
MRRLAAIWLLLLTALVAVPPQALAQTSPAAQASAGAPSFLEVCADKTEERGRLRYCDDYFRQGLGAGADPVLYLRDRITRLRASHEASAADKYQSFLTAVYITAFLTIATIVLVTSERRIAGISKWSTATSALALLVLVGALTYGWLDKSQAEDAAMLELGLLRDQIETEASQAIAGGDGITDRQVERWNDRLHKIGLRFAQSYAGASVMPDLDRFTPTD